MSRLLPRPEGRQSNASGMETKRPPQHTSVAYRSLTLAATARDRVSLALSGVAAAPSRHRPSNSDQAGTGEDTKTAIATSGRRDSAIQHTIRWGAQSPTDGYVWRGRGKVARGRTRGRARGRGTGAAATEPSPPPPPSR